MELRLLRAQFPNSTMAQLFMNNDLVCLYVGTYTEKGWTPIASLPDGRYCLHKPAEAHKDWHIQVTSVQKRPRSFMTLNNLLYEDLTGYDKDVPLYVSWGITGQRITPTAKRNIDKIIAAIEQGDEVYLSIFSQYLG